MSSFATKIISFILIPIYTGNMSAGEYGLIDMSLTVISLVTPLATLSMMDACLRFVIINKSNENKYIALTTGITFFSIIIVALLSPILDLSIFGGLGDYRLGFVLAYAASALSSMCGNIARAVGKVKLIPLCSLISSVITLVSAVVLIAIYQLGPTGYFVSVTVGPFFAVVLYFIFGDIGQQAVGGVRAFDSFRDIVNVLMPMLKYALPLIPNGLFWWAQTSISRLFITGILGITASGMYAAASKIPNLMNTIYQIFQQAWQLSAYQEYGNADVARFYSTIFRILQAGLTILCATLSFLSPYLADVLLKGETYEAWPFISILLLASLANVFNGYTGTVYTSTMHTSAIMKTTVLGATLCVLLTPLFILPLGIPGACVASALSQGAVFLVRVIDARRYVQFDIGGQVLLPTLIILVLQAIVTMAQIKMWQAFSAGCLLAVLILQLTHNRNLIVRLIKSGRRTVR